MSRRWDGVIFDLGGVVLGWDPRRAFAEVLSPADVGAFLTKIDFPAWNSSHDAGQQFEVGEAALLERFPEDERAIRAYRANFARTLTGQVPGTGAVIAELERAGVERVALTNWSAETYPYAERRFGILRRFTGILVSGSEGVAKPDPAIFTLACDRFGLDPQRSVFVDDSAVNVAAAAAAGLRAIEFVDAQSLRRDLVRLGLLDAPRPVTAPVSHLAVAADWSAGTGAGAGYSWSTRGVSYDAEGYVHCSFPAQVAGTRNRHYADLADDELLLVELDLELARDLVVVEDLGAGESFPHLYAPLTPGLARRVTPYGR